MKCKDFFDLDGPPDDLSDSHRQAAWWGANRSIFGLSLSTLLPECVIRDNQAMSACKSHKVGHPSDKLHHPKTVLIQLQVWSVYSTSFWSIFAH